jgi:hypothetical protein
MTLSPIDPANRIQLPADWVKAAGLHGLVALEQTRDGILIRPCPRTTWQDIFATKLVIGSGSPDQAEDTTEVSGDDFLF